MRKIDKGMVLATGYKTWLDNLKTKSLPHPPYSSSGGKFFYDIVANLMWIQTGVCAYSERKMQDHRAFAPSKWKSGKFAKFQFAGQLDHYDSTLKEKYGWLWDNFFLIDSDINVKLKRTKKPNGLLRPDLPKFDPADFLEYDIKINCFIPKRTLDFDVQEKVRQDISILGLNFQPIIDLRREYLSPIIEDVKYKRKPIDEARLSLYQFFTAFELSKGYMES
jgi:hypothetical protein